jgi:hypothetical protein
MEKQKLNLGRHETLCVSCGTILREINRPLKQTCECGDISAWNGSVHTNEKPQKQKQTALFQTQDYPE